MWDAFGRCVACTYPPPIPFWSKWTTLWTCPRRESQWGPPGRRRSWAHQIRRPFRPSWMAPAAGSDTWPTWPSAGPDGIRWLWEGDEKHADLANFQLQNPNLNSDGQRGTIRKPLFFCVRAISRSISAIFSRMPMLLALLVRGRACKSSN